MKPPSELIPPLSVGWTTTESREQAEKLATLCVEQKKVACAQISGPIHSIYFWKGEAQKDQEWRLTLKFPTSRTADVTAFLKTHHPYEVPQWMVVDALFAGPEYAQWAGEQTE